MLTPDCKSRLRNWKFEQAAKYLTPEATREERETVEALASLLGNSGWFFGDLGTLVDVVVDTLAHGELRPPSAEKMEEQPDGHYQGRHERSDSLVPDVRIH